MAHVGRLSKGGLPFLLCYKRMTMKNFTIVCGALLVLLASSANGQIWYRSFAVDRFIPWEMVDDGDGLLVSQKNGYLLKINYGNNRVDTLMYEPATSIRGEGGMLGMAKGRDENDGMDYLYLAYNYEQGSDYLLKVVRMTYIDGVLGPQQNVIQGIPANTYHNGCRLLVVGDKLFVTTGDAQHDLDAQDVGSLSGKVLRLELDGGIPDDNPIPDNPVWTWGHRNPQGLVYAKDRLYSSEHGPDTDDEVNILVPGRNYGWPMVKGYCDEPAEIDFCNDSAVVEPIMAWTPTLAVSSIDYYKSTIFAFLRQSLVMATLKDGHLYVLSLNDAGDSIVNVERWDVPNEGRLRAVRVVGERIYVSTSNSAADGNGPSQDKILEVWPFMESIADLRYAQGLSAYPNPAQDWLSVKGLPVINGNWQYRIIDLNGRPCKKGEFKERVPVNDLPDGMYLLELRQGDNIKGRMPFVKK